MLFDGIVDHLNLPHDSHLFECLHLCEMVGLVFVLHIEIPPLWKRAGKCHKFNQDGDVVNVFACCICQLGCGFCG